VLQVENISKRFYNIVALDDVSFSVPRGSVVGVVGPNGAGKSTLFRILAGFLNPDSGAVRASGGVMPAVGYKPERLLFPGQMRVDSYLQLAARLSLQRGASATTAVAEALATVQLSSAARQRIKNCSKGMRQRVGIAQTLLGQAPLLLFDEPWNGLDPAAQTEVESVFRRLREEGRTLIISTHRLHELTRVCTHLVILSRGRVRYADALFAAQERQPQITIEDTRDLAPLAGILRPLHPGVRVAGSVVVLEGEAMALRRQVLSLLLSAGFDMVRLETQRKTLHDIYTEAIQ